MWSCEHGAKNEAGFGELSPGLELSVEAFVYVFRRRRSSPSILMTLGTQRVDYWEDGVSYYHIVKYISKCLGHTFILIALHSLHVRVPEWNIPSMRMCVYDGWLPTVQDGIIKQPHSPVLRNASFVNHRQGSLQQSRAQFSKWKVDLIFPPIRGTPLPRP
jgi:hypothetical protein